MFDEDEPPKKKSKPVSPGKPAAGKCLCGKVAFEIDVPARWAWHDHSAASRRAHGAAYASYVGSWRKRFRITRGKAALARYEDAATKTARSFCATCGTPVMYERARSPHMVNIPRALFASRTGASRSITTPSRNCRNGPIPARPWCRLRAFPAGSGSARSGRGAPVTIRSNSPAGIFELPRIAAIPALHCAALSRSSTMRHPAGQRTRGRGGIA